MTYVASPHAPAKARCVLQVIVVMLIVIIARMGLIAATVLPSPALAAVAGFIPGALPACLPELQ